MAYHRSMSHRRGMTSTRRKLKALVNANSAGSQTVVEMLDEIARLRGILERSHAADCAVLRTGDSCTCSHAKRAASAIAEIAKLRAEVLDCRRIIASHEREIARLDVALVEALTDAAVAAGGAPASAAGAVAMMGTAAKGTRAAAGTPSAGTPVVGMKSKPATRGLVVRGSKPPADTSRSGEGTRAVGTTGLPTRR